MELIQIIGDKLATPVTVLSGIVHKGAYAGGTDYAVGDTVSYNGTSYVMYTDAVAGTLPTDTTKWQVLSSPEQYVQSIGDLALVNATTDNTISVDQNGNVGTAVATDGAVHIENTGNTGIGLGVYSNIGATADAELVSIHVDNVAFDEEALVVRNDGAGTGVFIDNDGQGKALYIDAESTSQPHLHVICGAVTTAGDGIVYFQSGSATASAEVLRIRQEGTGEGIVIDQNGLAKGILIDAGGNGAHMRFIGDPTVASPEDGDLWFDGTNLKLRIGAVTHNIDTTPA